MDSLVVGMRVGVFHSCEKKTLALLGYGTYEGEEVPPEGILGQVGPLNILGWFTPKLKLDDGTVIWGCEAWWGPEPEIKAMEQGRQIVKPKIESLRKKRLEDWEKACKELDEAEEALP
jgi:hypothetical protein